MRIIGIAGGSGSGKSTLTARLCQAYPATQVLYYDNYYRDRSALSPAERAVLNFDHPDALETPLLIDHLRALRAGHTVRCPIYDFSTHTRSQEDCVVKPAELLIVEGILLFHEAELRALFDLKLFVDVDADIRLLRRIQRDTVERGRTLEDIAAQYLSTVRPMHQQFVELTKCYADLLVHDCMDPAEWATITARVNQLLNRA